MKGLKIFGIVVIILVLVGLIEYAYLGGFSTVQVAQSEWGPVNIIAYRHKGPYADLRHSWTEFRGQWEKAGLKECESLAVYLDPPETPPEKLRSILGCRLDHLPAAQQAELRKAFLHLTIPRRSGLSASFPFKNVLSFWVGPTKVYPAIHKQFSMMSGATMQVAVETYGHPDRIQEVGFFMPTNATDADFEPFRKVFQ